MGTNLGPTIGVLPVHSRRRPVPLNIPDVLIVDSNGYSPPTFGVLPVHLARVECPETHIHSLHTHGMNMHLHSLETHVTNVHIHLEIHTWWIHTFIFFRNVTNTQIHSLDAHVMNTNIHILETHVMNTHIHSLDTHVMNTHAHSLNMSDRVWPDEEYDSFLVVTRKERLEL